MTVMISLVFSPRLLHNKSLYFTGQIYFQICTSYFAKFRIIKKLALVLAFLHLFMSLKSSYLWIKINQEKERSEVICEMKGEKLLSNLDIYICKALQWYAGISELQSLNDLEWEIQLGRTTENHAVLQKSKCRWQYSFVFLITF